MDVRMPVLDGLQATRQITAAGDGAPRILVLTTFDLDDYVYEALRSGASGFLLKDASAGELWGGSVPGAGEEPLPESPRPQQGNPVTGRTPPRDGIMGAQPLSARESAGADRIRRRAGVSGTQ